MNVNGNRNRFRSVVLALTAAAVAATLTACQNDDSAAGAGGAPSAGATAASSPGAAGGATPTGKPANKPGAPPAGAPAKKPTATSAGSAAPDADCASGPPSPDDADPDEFAVFRTEELPASTGKINLIIQHGAWGCPGKDTDGAPFVVDGEDSRWALDQAAYVTATTPITHSTENQRIGVQELIDWINANPDSGLVFRYELGDDGAIHRLDQVFTP
ncbi:hypothetical protein [Streptomyces sp. NPDC127084]|uniref:hypothetical protein n=1 Tax=Streptomyces sp. NPDC127084 TaxID=3347133 RepID=UPI00364664A0